MDFIGAGGPGIKHLQLAIECHFEPFNGAGGDHSPDVTRIFDEVSEGLVELQWGRG